jgi:hypothetical protein
MSLTPQLDERVLVEELQVECLPPPFVALARLGTHVVTHSGGHMVVGVEIPNCGLSMIATILESTSLQK